MSKALELSQKWDEGCENDTLDPGDLFGKAIDYCFKLEGKLEFAEKAKLLPICPHCKSKLVHYDPSEGWECHQCDETWSVLNG